MGADTVLLILILTAGLYMAWNIGANDVANAMGTSVGSGALTLKQAVLVAAILEFAGAFFFGSHVTETVQKGIIEPDIFFQDPRLLVYGMLASLISAGAWLQIASYFGWPVSTTHSIVGALVGFGAVVGGWSGIQWDNVIYILSSWILSPIFGALISFYIFGLLRKKIFYTLNPVESAKKLTPLLVFLVIITLSLLVVFKGIPRLQLNLSFIQASFFSSILALTGALISIYFVKKVKSRPLPQNTSLPNPDVVNGLAKAAKHLQRVQVKSAGDMRFQISTMLDEVRKLQSKVRPAVIENRAPSEYRTVENIFGYLQIISACMMAFAHGANDVANAIGPLVAAYEVLKTGTVVFTTTIPTWALALGGVGIIIGLATWGWRVIETIGKKITELTPSRGFAAEFGAAATILIASRLGMPVSTTHTLVGAVIGVGLAGGIEALDLSKTRDIVLSWIITVPAGACMAIVFAYLIQGAFG